MVEDRERVYDKVVIAFDIDFTITTGANHKRVFEEKYPNLDFDKHYDVYPIEDSLIKYGFEEEGFKRFTIYKERGRDLFGKSTLEPWFLEFYNRIKGLDWVDYHFITARNVEYGIFTKELFEQHNLPYEKVHHLGGYHKEVLSKELGVRIVFEDHVDTIERILKGQPNCFALKINRTYNQTDFEHPRMVSINVNHDPKETADKLMALLQICRTGGDNKSNVKVK